MEIIFKKMIDLRVTSLPVLKIFWILMSMSCVSCQLLALPSLPNARTRTPFRTVSIRKCCQKDQCLDRNYECVNLPGKLTSKQKSEQVKKIFQRSVCAQSKCAITFTAVGISCLTSQRNVTSLRNNFENETLLFLQREALEGKNCLDLSLKLNSILEGPLVVRCQFHQHFTRGFFL
jgi:hypothetical protein